MLASVVDLTVRYIIVSSAKSRTLLLTESGRSFIYARKRHGPNTDPWGTSDTTGNVSEVHPSIRTCWVRHCKNLVKLVYTTSSGALLPTPSTSIHW